MTAQEAGVVLDALHAAFPRTLMSDETISIYARFLVDIPLAEALEAVAKLIARGKGFPTIAEIRELADTRRAPDHDLAWGEVKRWVSKCGAYGDPSFSHAAVAAAVGSLGWREICLSENEEATRAHFMKAYESARKRHADPGHVQLVAGIVADVKQRLAKASTGELTRGASRVLGARREP